MPDDNALSCHQRPTWTRGDMVLGVMLWTVIVFAVFAWSHRETILAWFVALQ